MKYLAFLAMVLGPVGFLWAGQISHIEWQADTLTLVHQHSTYPRIARVSDDHLIAAYERGGRGYVKHSLNNGRSWSNEVLVAQYAHGSAANAEIKPLPDGRLLFMVNERNSQDRQNNGIAIAFSSDNGYSWSQTERIYTGSCWEPVALLRGQNIEIYFADEQPYLPGHEQNISAMWSQDNGQSWNGPRIVSFRQNHRDGMPVPVELNNGKIVMAIEDDGLFGAFKPTIIDISDIGNMPVLADSPYRWGAMSQTLPADTYAGAPYITQVGSGPTVLSMRYRPAGVSHTTMLVVVGDENAGNFTNPSTPFSMAEPGTNQDWSSLFAKDEDTVTAVSPATIDGVRGVWTIDGKVTSTAASPQAVAHYTFNRAPADVLYDSSGNQLHGTLRSQMDYEKNSVAGMRGTALSFDGQQEYIELPAGFANLSQGMTITLWANPTEVKTWARFVDLGNGPASDNIIFGRYAQTNDLVFNVHTGSQGSPVVRASNAIRPNQWHFYAVTVDRQGAVSLYRNGRLLATGQSPLPWSVVRTSNYIARSNWSADQYYAGYIDDVRIFNYPLSREQLGNLYRKSRQILHHWKLQDEPQWITGAHNYTCYIEDSGSLDSNAYIRTTREPDGRPAVLFNQPGAFDESGGSIGLTGEDEYVRLGFVSPGQEDFTLRFWFKLADFQPESAHILSADASQPGLWNIHLWGSEAYLDNNADRPRLRFQHGSNNRITLLDSVEYDKWYRITMTRNTFGQLGLYVDDAQVYGRTDTISFTDAPEQGLWLGAGPAGQPAFVGFIDDVRIYNYAIDHVPDLTGNETVDAQDLRVMAEHWLMTDCSPCMGADVNIDGRVDFTDVGALARHWLKLPEHI